MGKGEYLFQQKASALTAWTPNAVNHRGQSAEVISFWGFLDILSCFVCVVRFFILCDHSKYVQHLSTEI